MPKFEGIWYVLALHESIAVSMADGYAQARRGPAVASVHASPGFLHCMSALYNAKVAGTPVIVLAGQIESEILIRDPFLASDFVSASRGYAKWAWELRSANEIRYAIRRAVKVATSPPTGPVVLSVPRDFFDEEIEWDMPMPTDYRSVPWDYAPEEDVIERASELLLNSESPAMICGPEVRWFNAIPECVSLADLLGLKVYDDVRFGIYFPVTHRFYFGSFTKDDLKSHDLILVVGQKLFYERTREQVPLVSRNQRILHITTDPIELGKNYEATLCILGNPKNVVAKLVKKCSEKLSSWSEKVERRKKELERERSAKLDEDERELKDYYDRKPVSPHRLVREVDRVFGNNGRLNVVVEAVTTQPYIRRYLKSLTGDNYYSSPGAALGWGVAAAVGVKLARGEEEVVCFTGDGAFMYYPQSLWTAARMGLKIVTIIANNRAYMNDKLHLMSRRGHAYKMGYYQPVEIDNPPISFVSIAKGIGCDGLEVKDPSELQDALEKALSSDRPFVIDVRVDPEVFDRSRV